MNLLHLLRDTEFASIDNRRLSPLRAWLCTHGISSLDKYLQLEAAGFDTPLVFQAETPLRKIIAYIDPENKFSVTDKLSQVRVYKYSINIISFDPVLTKCVRRKVVIILRHRIRLGR